MTYQPIDDFIAIELDAIEPDYAWWFDETITDDETTEQMELPPLDYPF